MTRQRPALGPSVVCEDVSPPAMDALDLAGDTNLSSTASGFFSHPNVALIGPALLQLISEQQTCIQFKELCALGRLKPTYHDIQYIYTAQIAADYRLLEMPFSEAEGDIAPAQDAVRLALYIFAQPIVNVAKPASAFCRAMARQLQEALELSELFAFWESSNDLLLWVLFIGARISHGQEEWAWLVSHIALIVTVLDIRSRDEMKGVLMGFFYFSNSFDETLEEVWREVDIILQAPKSCLK